MKDKNDDRLRLIYCFIILLFVFSVFRGFYLKNNLKNNFILTKGRIHNVDLGGQTPSGVSYKFIVDNETIKSKTGGHPSDCRLLILRNLNYFKEFEFDVIYERGNPNNSELLLFRKQYEEYGIDFPPLLEDPILKIS